MDERDDETAKADAEYEKRRDSLKAEMKKHFKVNCDSLVAEMFKFMKNNPPLHGPAFCILPLDFMDGSDDPAIIVFGKIFTEISTRFDARIEKARKALNFAQASGKTFEGTRPENIPRFEDIIAVFHSYDSSGMYLVISHPQKNLLASTIDSFIIAESSLGIYARHKTIRKDTGVVNILVYVEAGACPTKNPMIDRELLHKYAFQYFLRTGVIKRDETDDEDEMIFGDDDLL